MDCGIIYKSRGTKLRSIRELKNTHSAPAAFISSAKRKCYRTSVETLQLSISPEFSQIHLPQFVAESSKSLQAGNTFMGNKI